MRLIRFQADIFHNMNSSNRWESIVNQLVAERDSLRQQNDELWKLVETLRNELKIAHDELENLLKVHDTCDKEAQTEVGVDGPNMERDITQPLIEHEEAPKQSVPTDDANVKLNQELFKLLSSPEAEPSVADEVEVNEVVKMLPESTRKAITQDNRKSFADVTPPPPIVTENKQSPLVSPLRIGSAESVEETTENITETAESPAKVVLEESQISTPNAGERSRSSSIEMLKPAVAVPKRKDSLGGEGSPRVHAATLAKVVARSSLSDEGSSKPAVPEQEEAKDQTESLIRETVPKTLEGRIDALVKSSEVHVQVISSAVRLNEQGKEFTVYIISVKAGDHEKWRIQKRYSDFLTLHEHLRKSLPSKTMSKIGKVPGKTLFQQAAVAPAQTDKKIVSLELFLNNVIRETFDTHMNRAIVQFLCLDILSLLHRENKYIFKDSLKEGYLTKRGKRTGGWKKRFFVLKLDRFEYYDSQEQALSAKNSGKESSGLFSSSGPLGVLFLKGCWIGVKKADSHSASTKDHRHAFLITEPLEADAPEGTRPKKHILCAESDVDRDEWAWLISNCIVAQDQKAVLQSQDPSQNTSVPKISIPPPPSVEPPAHLSNRMTIAVTPTKDVKNSVLMENVNRPASSMDNVRSAKDNDVPFVRQSPPPSLARTGRVFGVPLEEAVKYSKAKEGYELPSVVYRCIEYLDHHRAFLEEGIYRLSGRNALILSLRDQFEKEGDVQLMKNARQYDVHSVAGLLKLFLRELPDSLLTNEMYREFLDVTDLNDRSDKIIELARLVSMLPLAHYTLLRTLISHLIAVIQHSDVNKMTARNVGIVFAPTLKIPAGIFTLMMAEFEFIFWVNGGDGFDSVRSKSETASQTAAEKRKSKRLSWLPNQVEVKNRNNRNSKIFEENAPDAVKFYEEMMIKKRDSGQNMVAEQQLHDMDDQDEIDLYEQTMPLEERTDIKLPTPIKERPDEEEEEERAGSMVDSQFNQLNSDDRMSRTFSFIEMYNTTGAPPENRKSILATGTSIVRPSSPSEESTLTDDHGPVPEVSPSPQEDLPSPPQTLPEVPQRHLSFNVPEIHYELDKDGIEVEEFSESEDEHDYEEADSSYD